MHDSYIFCTMQSLSHLISLEGSQHALLHANLRHRWPRHLTKLWSGLGEEVNAKAEKQWKKLGSVNASLQGTKTYKVKPGQLCSLVHDRLCTAELVLSDLPPSHDDLPGLTVSVPFTGADGTTRPSWRLRNPRKYQEPALSLV